MEVLGVTILSVFAFLGVISAATWIFRNTKQKFFDTGIKFILYLPPNCTPNLEGIVRRIFSEELPKILMTDGKLYVKVDESDEEMQKTIDSLKCLYPIERLPDGNVYCMITEKIKTQE